MSAPRLNNKNSNIDCKTDNDKQKSIIITTNRYKACTTPTIFFYYNSTIYYNVSPKSPK